MIKDSDKFSRASSLIEISCFVYTRSVQPNDVISFETTKRAIQEAIQIAHCFCLQILEGLSLGAVTISALTPPVISLLFLAGSAQNVLQMKDNEASGDNSKFLECLHQLSSKYAYAGQYRETEYNEMSSQSCSNF